MVMPMQSHTQITTLPHKAETPGVAKEPRRWKRGWLAAGAVLLVFGGLLIYGIVSRLGDEKTVRAETAQMAAPSVSVATPQRSAPAQEIVLPGNVQPFISSPVTRVPMAT